MFTFIFSRALLMKMVTKCFYKCFWLICGGGGAAAAASGVGVSSREDVDERDNWDISQT